MRHLRGCECWRPSPSSLAGEASTCVSCGRTLETSSTATAAQPCMPNHGRPLLAMRDVKRAIADVACAEAFSTSGTCSTPFAILLASLDDDAIVLKESKSPFLSRPGYPSSRRSQASSRASARPARAGRER